MERGIVKSLYLPEYCLDGTDLPAHIIWHNNSVSSVRITFDKEISVKNVFNVTSEDSIESGEGYIIVRNFAVDGYLGILFTPKLQENASKELEFEFVISVLNEEQFPITIVKNVRIFRPFLKLLSVPKKIDVKYDKNRKSWDVTPKIQLTNVGEGTGLIRIGTTENNKAKITPPANINEFIEGFFSGLVKRFQTTKRRFSEYTELIDSYVQFLKNPSKLFDKEEGDPLDPLLDELEKVLEIKNSYRDSETKDEDTDKPKDEDDGSELDEWLS